MAVSSNLALINGPLLLGTLFGYGLFGILMVQVFIYHHRFPNDLILTKVLVWTVFVADIVLTVLPTIVIWRLLITGWGNPATIGLLEWPFIGITIISGYVTTAVHVFFCWRIWKLRESRTLPCIVVVVSFIAWGMEASCGIRGVMLGTTRIHELEPFVIVWLVGSAFCDMTITVTLVSILITRGAQTTFKESAGIIRRLVQLTVETAMVTTMGAISEVIIFSVFPDNNMHFLPFLMLAKLYSNSLLTTLNARSYINSVDTSVSLPLWEDQLQVTAPFSGRTFGTVSRASNGIHMTTFKTHTDHRGSISDVSFGDRKGEIVCEPDIVVHAPV